MFFWWHFFFQKMGRLIITIIIRSDMRGRKRKGDMEFQSSPSGQSVVSSSILLYIIVEFKYVHKYVHTAEKTPPTCISSHCTYRYIYIYIILSPQNGGPRVRLCNITIPTTCGQVLIWNIPGTFLIEKIPTLALQCMKHTYQGIMRHMSCLWS